MEKKKKKIIEKKQQLLPFLCMKTRRIETSIFTNKTKPCVSSQTPNFALFVQWQIEAL